MSPLLDKFQDSHDDVELSQHAGAVRPCPCCGASMISTPVINCTHCGRPLTIKCYVYKREEKFYGECLTLNLVSRGDTQEEAIKRLQGVMFTYVDAVFADGQSTEGLIPRPAPISSWLKYYLHVWRRGVTRAVTHRLDPLATKEVPALEATQYTVAEC